MEKVLLAFSLLLIVITVNANPYDLDSDEISQEFAEVNAIERMVEANQISSIEDLKVVSPQLHANFGADSINPFDDDELPLGIPPFLWGCCFGLIGIILVAVLADGDKSMTRKAVFGCLVSYGTIAVVYILLIVLGVTTAGLGATI